jgi:chromosome segregation ATPase
VADPAELMHILDSLQQVAPGLSTRVTDPLEFGDALGSEVEQFEEEWAQRVRSAEATVSALREALGDLETRAEGIETRLQEQMTTIDVVADHHEEVLTAQLAELSQKMAAAGDAMNELQKTLVTAAQDIETAASDAATASENVAEAARTGQEQLEAASAAVLQEVQELEEEVKTGAGHVSDDLEAFAGELAAAVARAQSELSAALEEIARAVGDHAAAVDAAAGLVRDSRTELLTHLETEIVRAVATEVGGSHEAAVGALEAVEQSARDSASEAENSRPALKDAIEELEDKGGIVERGLDQVMDAAVQAGIPWPG